MLPPPLLNESELLLPGLELQVRQSAVYTGSRFWVSIHVGPDPKSGNPLTADGQGCRYVTSCSPLWPQQRAGPRARAR
jgi:hypothetical protein